MSRSEMIRDAIRQAGRPLSYREICDSVPGGANVNVNSISVMYKAGILDRIGPCKPFLYTLGRDPISAAMHSSERKRIKDEADAKRAASQPSLEELLKQVRARRKAQLERRAKARTAKSAPRKKPKYVVKPSSRIVVPPPKPKRYQPPAEKPQLESVEAFLARGGLVDVLPMGAASQPFKYIGQPLAMG